jgi:hypothetical protein
LDARQIGETAEPALHRRSEGSRGQSSSYLESLLDESRAVLVLAEGHYMPQQIAEAPLPRLPVGRSELVLPSIDIITVRLQLCHQVSEEGECGVEEQRMRVSRKT